MTTLTTNYTANYSLAPTPVFTLLWPQDGQVVSGSRFTLRGQVDNPTATISVTVTDTAGNTNVVNGLVERNGLVWAEKLPLGAGANTLTIGVTDAAGHTTQTTVGVVNTPGALTINDVNQSTLGAATVDVSGTIGLPNATLWVNGAKATLNGDGTWYATAPLGTGGTAVIQARAIPNSDTTQSANASSDGTPGNPDSANSVTAEMQLDKPAIYYRETYSVNVVEHYNFDNSDTGFWYNDTYITDTKWTNALAAPLASTLGYGAMQDTAKGSSGDWYQGYYFEWPAVVPPEGIPFVYTNFDGSTETANFTPEEAWSYMEGTADENAIWSEFQSAEGTNEYKDYEYRDYSKTTVTRTRLRTGGKALSGRMNLFAISASAREFIAPAPDNNVFWNAKPVDPTAISVLGKKLGSDGILYKLLPDNDSYNITPQVDAQRYEYGVTAQKHIFVHETLHPALTNPDRERTTLGVGEEVDIYFNPPLRMTFPEHPTWIAYAGGISPAFDPDLNGSSVRFTAPSNAATATVWVNVRDVHLSVDFHVLEPRGVDNAVVTNTDLRAFNIGESGASMHLHPYMAPTSVSFYRVQCEEVGEDASDVDGYFTNNPPFTINTLSHKGNSGPGKEDEWFQIQENNLWQEGWDVATAGPLPDLPWSNGHFTWIIPGKWKIGTGPTNNIEQGWDQEFTIDSSGTVTITKFRHTVIRHTNEATGTVN